MIALLINQRLTVNGGRSQHAGRFCIENGLLPSDRVIGEPFRVVAGRAFQKQFITYNAFDPCAVHGKHLFAGSGSWVDAYQKAFH